VNQAIIGPSSDAAPSGEPATAATPKTAPARPGGQ